MIRIILGILLIMLIAGLIGVDTFTCGYGPTIRKNVESLFNQNNNSDPIKYNK